MKTLKHFLSAALFGVFVILAFGSTDDSCMECMDVQYADNINDVKEAYDDYFEEIQDILESLCERFISRDETWQELKGYFGFLYSDLLSILDSYPYNNIRLHLEEQEAAREYGLGNLSHILICMIGTMECLAISLAFQAMDQRSQSQIGKTVRVSYPFEGAYGSHA